MIARRVLFSSIAFVVLPVAQAQAADHFSCKAGAQFGLYPDLDVTAGSAVQSPGVLAFAAPFDFAGNFLREDSNGTLVAHAVSGAVPATMQGVVREHLGSFDVVYDLTPHFAGDFSPADTKIVIDFSKPEGAYENFAASVTVWAEFSDGSRAMLCKNTGSGCLNSVDPIDCNTL